MEGTLAALGHLDTFLFLKINLGLANPFFDWLMPWVSDFTIYLPVVFVAGYFLLFRMGPRGRIILAAMVLMLLLTDWTTSQVFRPMLARLRPGGVLEGIRVYDHIWHVTDPEFIEYAAGSYGFPSAHASNTFGLAFLSLFFLPKAGRWVLALAVLVSFSRIYLGVHYPGDVLGGALWGLVSALIMALLARPLMSRYRAEKPFSPSLH